MEAAKQELKNKKKITQLWDIGIASSGGTHSAATLACYLVLNKLLAFGGEWF